MLSKLAVLATIDNSRIDHISISSRLDTLRLQNLLWLIERHIDITTSGETTLVSQNKAVAVPRRALQHYTLAQLRLFICRSRQNTQSSEARELYNLLHRTLNTSTLQPEADPSVHSRHILLPTIDNGRIVGIEENPFGDKVLMTNWLTAQRHVWITAQEGYCKLFIDSSLAAVDQITLRHWLMAQLCFAINQGQLSEAELQHVRRIYQAQLPLTEPKHSHGS